MLFAFEAAVSGLGYLALALAMGILLVSGFLLPDPDATMRRKLAAGALLLLGALWVTGCLAILVQGAKLSAGGWPSLDILIRYLSRTQSGKIWLARETYLLFVLITGLLLFRKSPDATRLRLIFFLLLPVVATRGLTGHAAATRENMLFLLIADGIHMLGVAFWAGGLPVLFWMLRSGMKQTAESPQWSANLVKRFFAVALGSVCLLVPSGLYQALIHVGGLSALFHTSYGRVLCLKLLLFVYMIAFGALNLFITKPVLARAEFSCSAEPRAVKAYLPIGWEGLMGGFVLVLTGFLTTLPPAVHSRHLSGSQADSREVHSHSHPRPHAPQPVFEPAEGAEVKILVPAAGQVFAGEQIPLQFTLVKGKRGHHVHAYVNEELMGMFQSDRGTLNGIPPGKHELELRVVTEDHRIELDARDRVEFIVK